MPNAFLSIDQNFPKFTGSESPGKKIEVVQNYLYMLVEYLRYVLNNLSPDNFNDAALTGFVDEIKADLITATTIVSNTVITQNLYAEYGDIAELTVDRLLTANKIEQYQSSNIADINYVWIEKQSIKLMTGATDGTTIQHVDRNKNLLYWYTAEKLGMSTKVTAFPVIVYKYTEYCKAELSFIYNAISGYDEAMQVFGTGSGAADPNAGKGVIYKGANGMELNYYNASSGDLRQIFLGDDAVKAAGNTGAGLNLRNIAIGTSAAIAALSRSENDLAIETDNYSRYDALTITSSIVLSISTPEVIICNAATALTLTLYAASQVAADKVAIIIVKNVGAGIVTVNVASSGTIDGAASTTIAQWGVKHFGTRYTEWMVL